MIRLRVASPRASNASSSAATYISYGLSVSRSTGRRDPPVRLHEVEHLDDLVRGPWGPVAVGPPSPPEPPQVERIARLDRGPVRGPQALVGPPVRRGHDTAGGQRGGHH